MNTANLVLHCASVIPAAFNSREGAGSDFHQSASLLPLAGEGAGGGWGWHIRRRFRSSGRHPHPRRCAPRPLPPAGEV